MRTASYTCVYPSLIADPRRPGRLTNAPVCSRHVLTRLTPRIALRRGAHRAGRADGAGGERLRRVRRSRCRARSRSSTTGTATAGSTRSSRSSATRRRSARCPVDVLDYSHAEEDILRALQFARTGQARSRPHGWPSSRDENGTDPAAGADERPRRPGLGRRGRRGCRHVRPVVPADPAPRARRARAAPARRRRRRLPQPSRPGPPGRRASRPRVALGDRRSTFRPASDRACFKVLVFRRLAVLAALAWVVTAVPIASAGSLDACAQRVIRDWYSGGRVDERLPAPVLPGRDPGAAGRRPRVLGGGYGHRACPRVRAPGTGRSADQRSGDHCGRRAPGPGADAPRRPPLRPRTTQASRARPSPRQAKKPSAPTTVDGPSRLASGPEPTDVSRRRAVPRDRARRARRDAALDRCGGLDARTPPLT